MADKNITLYGYLKTTKGTIKLTKQRISIGRNKNNQIVINNNTISKDHALIEFDEEYNCTIKDLNSSNGTYVNGQKLKSIPLKLRTGDKIKFGKYEVEYIFESSNLLNDTKTEKEILTQLSQNMNEINEQKDEITHIEKNNIKDGKISLVNENELSYPKMNHFQNKKNILYSFGNSNGINNNFEQNTLNNNNNQQFLNKEKQNSEIDNKIDNNEDDIVEQFTNDKNFINQNANNVNLINEYSLKNKYEELLKKIQLIEKEKNDLEKLLNDKSNKLKQLNILFDELNEEYSKLNSNHSDLINYTSDIQKKLDLAYDEISKLKMSNNIRNENDLNEIMKQKDNIIQILQSEVNYYKELCNKKGISISDMDEKNKLNTKLNTISNIFVNENNKLKKKLEFYKNKVKNEENSRNKNNIDFREFETQINYQIDNFNNIIADYNSKLLDSLNKLSEIFDSNNKEEAAKYLVNQINEYMLENQKLISENAKLNTQILELQSILNSDHKNNKQLNTNKNFNNYDLINDNMETNFSNNSEINKLKNKINEMENIVEKLKNINTNNKYKNDYNYLKDSFMNLLNDLKSKEKMIQDLQNKLKNTLERNTINFDENQIVKSVSHKLKEKDKIIQNLKNQINPIKNFDMEDSKLKIENIRRKRELFN